MIEKMDVGVILILSLKSSVGIVKIVILVKSLSLKNSRKEIKVAEIIKKPLDQ